MSIYTKKKNKIFTIRLFRSFLSFSCLAIFSFPTLAMINDEDEETIKSFFKNTEVNRVFFKSERNDLDSNSKHILQKQATWLLKHPEEEQIEIAGYCDPNELSDDQENDELESKNMKKITLHEADALGHRRANTVKQHLISLGVDTFRLSTISYGKRVILVPDNTEEACQQNRTAITTLR